VAGEKGHLGPKHRQQRLKKACAESAQAFSVGAEGVFCAYTDCGGNFAVDFFAEKMYNNSD
jgi:hypothetical protein